MTDRRRIDANGWVIIIAAIGISLTQAITAWKASVKVDEVKATLEHTTQVSEKKLDGLAVVAAATHKWVNSLMGLQLKKNAELSRRMAVNTGLQADIDAADISEALLKEHEAQQAKVDSKKANQ